jgi:hypothetical protein
MGFPFSVAPAPWLLSRIVNDAGHGASVDGEADRYGELRYAFDELTGPVDRVDDPDPLRLEALEIVLAFLRQPAVFRIPAEEHFLDL